MNWIATARLTFSWVVPAALFVVAVLVTRIRPDELYYLAGNTRTGWSARAKWPAT